MTEVLTRINGSHSSLNDKCWQSVKTRKSLDNRTKDRELGNHVQEECDQSGIVRARQWTIIMIRTSVGSGTVRSLCRNVVSSILSEQNLQGTSL